MRIKIYGHEPDSEIRYSLPEVIGHEIEFIQGKPDLMHISTPYIERQNLTKQMSMRRVTQLTNGFSKKVENHMHYNFARTHKTLRVTPAMEAGICGHVWSIEDIANLAD